MRPDEQAVGQDGAMELHLLDRIPSSIDLADLQLGEEIGFGGEGNVFRVLGQPDLVAKIYRRPSPANGAWLEHMVAQLRTGRSIRVELLGQLMWPVATIRNRHEVVGAILPLLDDSYMMEFLLPSGRSHRVPRELQYALAPPEWHHRRGITLPTSRQRLEIVRSIAWTLGALHDAGLVFGDISPKNIVYRLTPTPRTLVMDFDCIRDAHHTASNIARPPALQSPDWSAPNGEPYPTPATDCYKIGLVAWRLLAAAPASSPDSAPAFDALIGRALVGDPEERPSARAWVEQIDELLNADAGVGEADR